MNKNKVKAVLYARVSTREKQETENQLEQLRDFARTQHWKVECEYQDHESGTTAKRRPQFLKLLDDASRHKFDVVLFWSLDRFSREGPTDTLLHLRRLSEYGVKFRSFTQAYLDTCGIFGEAVVSIIATIAKQEAITISDRTKAGLVRARRRGVRLGRPVKSYDRGKLRRAIAAGHSLKRLAKALKVSPSTAARLKRKEQNGR